MSSISVTVNGQSGPNLTATSGDQIGVVVGSPPAPIALTVTTAGAPGGQGIQGPPGSVNLSDDTPTALGTAAAGTSADASRSDHVHALPTATQLGLSAVATSGSYADLTGTPAAYTLPVASSVTLGGIKVGSGLKISSGVLSTTGGGGSGVSLSDATPQPLGTASAGTSTSASRSDHVHAVPTISYLNLTNVPSTFAPSAHTHTASQISDLSTSVATSVAGRTGDVLLGVDDVSGLSVLIAGSVVDADGGDYVGVVVSPTITITSQPSNYAASLTVGSTWRQTGNASSGWRGVAYNGSRWVIVGTQYNLPVGYYTSTSTDAVTWTTRGTSSSPQFAASGVATDGTNFLAVGDGKWASSSDGLSWSGGTLPITANAVAYGNSRYLAVGGSSTYTTNGGSSWSSPLTLPVTFGSVCYGSSGFVALQSSASASWSYLSADGTSWTAVTLPASATWAGVAFGGGKYVAIRSGSTAAVSQYGDDWTTVNMPSNQTWRAVTYAAGRFFAFAYNSASAAVSTDGQTWSAITLPAIGKWLASAGGSSNVLAVNTGTGSHAYSVGSSSASFSVAAVSTASLSYQWELSTDSGSSWNAISGASSATLTLSNLTTGDTGKQVRCVVSATGTASVTSNAATLTVT